MNTPDNNITQLTDLIDSHRAACEQFALNTHTTLKAAVIQRDSIISEQAAEIDQRINEHGILCTERDAAQAQVIELQSQCSSYEARIAELNAAIDLAQGQG